MSQSSVFEKHVERLGAPETTEPAETTAGDPSAIGTPAFIVGSIALGLVLTGLVPATDTGSAVPIIVTATALGQTIAAIWAARLGQDAIATVFGVFSGFWWSYAALALGLVHNWYGITTPAGVLATEKVFQISWLTVFVLLTLFTFRLPLVFTVLFALVDVAVLLVTVGIFLGSETWTKAGGWATLGFTAVGVYLFLHGLSTATGGRAMPLGRPVLH
jgi:succinate-acetate transporter protein